MNSNNSRRIKIKYILLGIIFVWLSLAVAAYPIWIIAEWLAEALNVSEGVPVKDQENGWLWFVLFLIEASIIFITLYSTMGFLFSRMAGWSTTLYVNIFLKGKYPHKWYK